MTFYFRHESSGMRRGYIRYPDGSPPTPSGCRWCGRPEWTHYLSWSEAVRYHTWAAPTQAQMRARIRARMKAKEEKK